MRKLIIAMLVSVLVLAPAVYADPQPLTDAQVEQIRQNCQTSQGVLQQIQRNDAAARINRGQAYEALLKLVANFNSRVALNKLDAASLVTTTSNISQRVGDFQADYLQYEDALSSSLKVKCHDQPVTFYDSLTNARDLRAKVGRDIQDIDTMLDSYQKAFSDLRATIEQPKQGAAAQ